MFEKTSQLIYLKALKSSLSTINKSPVIVVISFK